MTLTGEIIMSNWEDSGRKQLWPI